MLRSMFMAAVSMVAISEVCAQTSAPQSGGESEVMMEEVVITGIRKSLADALDLKRDANSFVDAISAEDIGKFPDKNIAESLSRISGIGVSREFGEGERVTVRGTGSSQNRTLLNGATVASTNWFTLDQPSRGFNFLILPSNLVSRLEVYKTPQADIQEGSLGGTISLRTRRPLEIEPHTFSFQGQAQYSDNSERVDPELSALYSWRNKAETFGVLASYTYQVRNVNRFGREVIGFVNPDSNPSGVLLPRLIGETDFRQRRERRTFFGSVQWKPIESVELLFNTLRTNFDADNINQNNLATIGSDGAVLDLSSITVAGTGISSGVVAGRVDATPGGAGARLQAFDRRSSINGRVYDLTGTYTADKLAITGRIGRTKSEGGAPDERFFGFTSEGARPAGAVPGAIDELTFDQSLNIGFNTATGPETEEQFLARPFEFGNARSTLNTEDENYIGADVDYALDSSIFKKVKTGVLYQDHGVAREATLTGFHWFSDSQHLGPGSRFAVDLQPGARAFLTFTPTGAVFGNATSLSVADFTRGRRGADYPLIDSGLAREIGTPPEGQEVGVLEDFNGTWDLNEKTISGYIQSDFEAGGMRGNVGLRISHTDLASRGFRVTGDAFGAAAEQTDNFTILATAFGCVAETDCTAEQVTERSSYTELLPNFNIAFDLTETLLMRFGAARVISRPNYEALALRESFFVNTGTGTRGNPDLRPTRANQFDVGLEWYFARQALLGVTLFYKDIENNLVTSVTTETRINPDNGLPVEIQFSTPQNGQNARVRGVEVSYQQNFGNFGAVLNYTFTDATTNQERDPINTPNSGLVAGTSRHVLNATGFYENDQFSARLSYNYRSSFLNEIPLFGAETTTAAFSELDFSASYRVTKYAELTFEVVNILDERTRQFNQIEERRTFDYDNDRRFLAGINVNF